MLAENFCYMRPNMMVLNMVEEGVFGDTVYAEGAYIHDCRALNFAADAQGAQDKLTWRGEYRRWMTGNTYPTHSLGPVSRWLGINCRDRLVSTATWTTPGVAAAAYARERFGPELHRRSTSTTR